jgi:hypothetical protein
MYTLHQFKFITSYNPLPKGSWNLLQVIIASDEDLMGRALGKSERYFASRCSLSYDVEYILT